MTFKLDKRLQDDCFVLGRMEFSRVLLMNNAAVPWFVLVPNTQETEIFDLPSTERAMLWDEVDRMAEYMRHDPSIEKLNIAAIGNVVSQLHVHIVGRRQDDYCWPDVVWGRPSEETYTDVAVAEIVKSVADHIEVFVP
ncbi:MAG: HIT domain-containing protein [Gammaproteobacteria bacterium]|nr:MAG: HIT domain-containing protein [Gammaproteobacteria bacterium]